MRKLAWMIIIFLAFAGGAFGLENYVVQTVSGRVERAAAGGKWELVKEGDAITGDTVIKTGIGAVLTIKSGEKTFTIGAVQNDKVAVLVETGEGIRIEGRVAHTNTAGLNRNAGKIITASARSEDALEEETPAVE
jgi:hypothetical protein